MRCFEHNIGLIIAKKMQKNCATNYGLDCTVCARFQSRLWSQVVAIII